MYCTKKKSQYVCETVKATLGRFYGNEYSEGKIMFLDKVFWSFICRFETYLKLSSFCRAFFTSEAGFGCYTFQVFIFGR